MRWVPLLPVALALVVGIAVARLLPLPIEVWMGCMGLSALLAACSVLFLRGGMRLVRLWAILFCFGVGGTLLSSSVRNEWVNVCDRHTYVQMRLTDSPQPRPRSWMTHAQVLSVDGKKASGSIVLFLRKDSVAASLRYGDCLLVHGYPDTARRSMYTTSDHYTIVSRDNKSLRAHSESVRKRLIRRVELGPLKGNAMAMVEALVLGWRASLSDEVRAAYRDAGIAHLLAVSGLHVGLLAMLVGWLLIPLGKERRGRAVRGSVQLVAIWMFAFLTGMSPSTVRASLMFSLFVVSDIAGRRTPKLNLLAATAIVTLLADPRLLFDVGWQLSYCAVAGILLAQPVVRTFRTPLWQIPVVSVVATLATLPVVVVVFHRLPVYFLIANSVIVPLAGILLACALVYVAIPSGFTAWPVEVLTDFADGITRWVSSIPGAVIENVSLSHTGEVLLVVLVVLLFAAIPMLSKWKDRAVD